MSTVLQGSPLTVTLPAGQTLTVVADAASSGRLFPFSERVGDTAGLSAVAASATVTLGPFANAAKYLIETISGVLTYSMATVDFPTATEVLAAAVALIIPVSGTIGDMVEMIGAGAPTDDVTGATVAGIGSRYTDVTAGKLYVNSGAGTKALPKWKLVTSA